MTVWSSCSPWITAQEVLDSPRACQILSEDATQGEIDAAAALAAIAAVDAGDILMVLSGRTVTGVCSSTFRPLVPAAQYIPELADGGCGCGGPLGFCPSATINLPGPIVEITVVHIDGEDAVEGVDYAIVGGDRLIRLAEPGTNRRRHWTANQRMDLPPTEIGTLEVVVSHGTEPPGWAKDAAAEVGAELLRYRMKRDTRISGAVALNAGGTSLQVKRASDALKAMATTEGLPCVVRFLSLVNPRNRAEPAEVWSPDISSLVEFTPTPP